MKDIKIELDEDLETYHLTLPDEARVALILLIQNTSITEREGKGLTREQAMLLTALGHVLTD